MTTTAEGIKVARLAHVGLSATDLSKQAAFYVDPWALDTIHQWASFPPGMPAPAQSRPGVGAR